MAMTSAQICTRAATIAKATPLTANPTAGLYLNMILQDLCQTYDFEVARNNFVFNFNPSSSSTPAYPNNTPGSGPYVLPADYLRVEKDAFRWFLNGVPYMMINCDLAEFDQQVQSAGMQSYPSIFATDMSASPPVAVIYPPASGAYQALIRYFCQMNDIGSGSVQQTPRWNPGATAPESASVVPWFPNQTYLITRLAGELMKDTADTRWEKFLGDGEEGAQGILDRYLKLKDDHDDRASSVSLDRRRFGTNFSKLKNTKVVGW